MGLEIGIISGCLGVLRCTAELIIFGHSDALGNCTAEHELRRYISSVYVWCSLQQIGFGRFLSVLFVAIGWCFHFGVDCVR